MSFLSNKKLPIFLYLSVILSFLVCNNLFACTDFLLVNENKNVVVGRSMEFATNLKSEIVLFPRKEKRVSILDNKQKGLSWISKYAYLAVTSFGLDLVADGMNEKGLSLGTLWFPGAKYPSVKAADLPNTIALEEIGNWILGNFATLDDLKQGLKKIHIYAKSLSQLKEVPPIHLSLHDRSGKSMVIEFIDGKMQVIDNVVGVLTNTPKFEWHVTNLENYINLSAIDKGRVVFDGTIINPTGQGSGLLGLPGDWTPPSRFVRIAIIKNFVKKTKTSDDNKNLAFHLLNTVDIPTGVVRSQNGKNFDYTQWVVVKDLSNKIFYYRTYKDLNIHMIDFAKEAKRLGAKKKKIPMIGAV
ncbi:MAG: Choloylglycine hydrolase [Candidatus Anoxychlamydiales bacterium]|nr:Choloylglycine hydrolase [Candidatus Anoxychlamydiales bacterium]